MLFKLFGSCFFWIGWVAAFVFVAHLLRRKPKVLFPSLAVILGIAAFVILYHRPNPTALEQINPEMVWDVHAMDLPAIKAHEFHGIYFAFEPDKEPLGPGTRLAVMRDGFTDWTEAFLEASRNNIPPPPGAFVGMPVPRLAMHIDPTGTRLVADAASSWDWADPSIKLANRHLASLSESFRNVDWYEDTYWFRRKVNTDTKPSWWPTRGDVAKHHTYGNYVPGRPAIYRIVSCTYLWDANPGMIGGFGPGNTTQVFTGPHELILEDFSTPTPRRVGFRLLGHNTKSIGFMQVSHDGSVGYIPDNAGDIVWIIPLYKAWEFLDSTTQTETNTPPSDTPTHPRSVTATPDSPD